MEPDGASACVALTGNGAGEVHGEMGPLPGRGRCLLGNWQEERATEYLDCVDTTQSSEGTVFRHGHRGLLTLDSDAPLAELTTMREYYRIPRKTGLPERGRREALLEWLLIQKYRKEVFEGEIQPPIPPTPLSTMHEDYRWEGPLSDPPPPTKPHNYKLEQPQTFWREYAAHVPGISRVGADDASFKKCAIFTTPVTEYLDLPWPYSPKDLAK